jgi:hypothetical protein
MTAEHEALLHQLRHMQTQIDDLQHQLRHARTRRLPWRVALCLAALALLYSWSAYSQSDSTEFLLMKQVASLETRMETIEKQLASGKFKAPFSVVDEKGAPVMSVFAGNNRGIYVLNDATKPGTKATGVSIEAGERAGVRVRGADQQAWIGGLKEGVGVYIADDSGEENIWSLMDASHGFEVRRENKRVIAMGMTEKNNVALRLYSQRLGPDSPLAAVGVSTTDDTGGFQVTDTEGNLLAKMGSVKNESGIVEVFESGESVPAAATMEVNDQGGVLAVHDEKGTAIGSLSHGDFGGLLKLTDFKGEVMVKGGTTDKHTGGVFAGPADGVMGSFLVGRPKP